MDEQREGGDITAADMVHADLESPSKIARFYTNSTIFLTGATGFLGKIFIEKLLRTCPDIERIYVLVRTKKGKEVSARFGELFEGPNFEPLRRLQPNFGAKVWLIEGDCEAPNLGLSDTDIVRLCAECDLVIHSAATVRFDEKLRTAANINLRATRDLIRIAKQMRKLKAFLHISTAFSQCTRTNIDEIFYDVPLTSEKLLALVDLLDDTYLEKITPSLLGKYPNTYVFTKAIAEDTVKSEAKTLPIAIIRPSIIIASVKEPVAGWIDNLYGATGVLVGAALGVLRSLYGRIENTAEMVPADYVINLSLAILWQIGTRDNCSSSFINRGDLPKKETKENENIPSSASHDDNDEIPIYNCVSSVEKKITWDDFTKLAEYHAKQVPSTLQVWTYFFAMRSNKFAHMLAVFFYHTLPAHLGDFVMRMLGKKPIMVKGYQKINKFANVLGYFANQEWLYTNANVQALWRRLGAEDKRLFEFSMANFDWDSYFYTYVRGARTYLLKDPMDTIPKGRVKYYKLMVLHYVLVGLFFLGVFRLIFAIFEPLLRI